MSASGHLDARGAAASPVRIMTVDDHPIFRDGLVALVGLHEDMEVVAEAGDGAQAIELFRAERPDVTLMDLSMPVMGGALARVFPPPPSCSASFAPLPPSSSLDARWLLE